eukprot:4888839-Karenia_brevis.AAC.1
MYWEGFRKHVFGCQGTCGGITSNMYWEGHRRTSKIEWASPPAASTPCCVGESRKRFLDPDLLSGFEIGCFRNRKSKVLKPSWLQVGV